MIKDRLFARSFALAAVVHLCGVGVVMASVRTRATRPKEVLPFEVTIDESAEPPPPPEPPPPVPELPKPATPPPEAVASLAPRPVAPRAPRSQEESSAPESAINPSPSVAPPQPSASASAEAWTAPVLRANPGGLAQLGLTPEARAHALAIPGGPGDKAEPGRDVGGVGSALAEQDLGKGMGQGGPLVAAVEDVTGGSRAPIDGAATFVIDANEKGEVTSVRAADVSSDEEAWREVAALLLAKMKNRPLRMKRGSRGVTVTLQVRSHLQLADGSSARGRLPAGARAALFPLKILTGNFDVTQLADKEFRRIEAWEVEERPR